MTTPKAKIERIQRLSAEEALRQPTPEEWLKQQDEKMRASASPAPAASDPAEASSKGGADETQSADSHAQAKLAP